jgi:hypothetical protein
MVRLLKFAIQFRGWCPYGTDATRSILALEARGFVKTRERRVGPDMKYPIARMVKEYRLADPLGG